jgi:murein DD-endopeptidase MepM/ murein hydrolase activator NlpD
MKHRYYVKIVPQTGDTVLRFLVRRRHVAALAAVFAAFVFGFAIIARAQVLRTSAEVSSLRQQRDTLADIGAKTQALRMQLQRVQTQNREIAALVGAPAPKPTPAGRVSQLLQKPAVDTVEANIRSLDAATVVTVQQSNNIKSLALRVLNVRHLRDIARAEELAAIPSIDPVNGAAVVGCFCYRTSPDVEFHEGVDLGADYGQTVRAAAAGTVVADGYDGAYGIKVDIDHGNGYHTWYAHLSRTSVTVGQHVYKGEAIAAVGATGFATGPHLHYQIMHQGTPIDPAPFLHGVPSNVLAALP